MDDLHPDDTGNQMAETICVVLACDENYAIHVAAAIGSAAAFTNRLYDLDVHVLSTGLAQRTRARLERLETSLNRLSVTVHDLSIDEFRSWRRVEHISQAAYLRLRMCDLVPPHYERLIYLDADTICAKPLDDLRDMDLGAAAIAAARDTSTPFVSSPRGIAEYEALGMPREAPYFNSGVLVVDTKRWQSVDPLAFAVDYVERYGSVQRALDQEILNACFTGAWLELHTRWNASPRLFNIDQWKDDDARKVFLTTAVEARTDPSIVHFLGPQKPWHFRSQAPWQDLYLDALASSGWFDSQAGYVKWRGHEALESISRRTKALRRWQRRLRQ